MKRSTAVLSLALLASACATPADLPSLRYLEASSRGDTPPRISEEEFRRSADLWADAVSDAGACRLPGDQILAAAFGARSELSAMEPHVEGRTAGVVAGALGRLVTSAFENRPRPDRGRCSRLARWLPQVQARREEAGDWSALERLLKGF